MPSISIIIPIYNAAKTLSRCLNSCIFQTLQDIEILLINNGSSDESDKIIKACAEARIKVINLDSNVGAPMARNIAMDRATGEFICFMDADDLYPAPDVLQSLYTAAKAHSVEICGGEFSEFAPGTLRLLPPRYFESSICHFDSPRHAEPPICHAEPCEASQSEKSLMLGEASTPAIFPNPQCLKTTFPLILWGYTFDAPHLLNYENYQFDFGYHRFIYKRDFLNKHNLRFPNFLRYEDPVFFVKAMIKAVSFYAINKIVYAYEVNDEFAKVAKWEQKHFEGLLKGLKANLVLAKEHNLECLYSLTLRRIRDYIFIVSKSLESKSFTHNCGLFALLELYALYTKYESLESSHIKSQILSFAKSVESKLITNANTSKLLKQAIKNVLS